MKGYIMEHLVSIIIPAYNMGKYVDSCLNSVLNQTYTNFEIIIVNDGSRDNTESICTEFTHKYSNVFLLTQDNQGVSVARNNGVALSKGDYILFLDADDTIPPTALKDLMDAARKHDSDMAIGKISPQEQIPVGTFVGEEFLMKCLEDNPIAYYSVRTLYKREFLHGISFQEDLICGEDSYFIFECALKKPTVVTIPACVYCYNVNPNSATRSAFSRKKYDSMCRALNKKEAIISTDFPHLLGLFYHLKTKIQMMLLANLASAKGSEFQKEERETLMRFNSFKHYFRADLPYSNDTFYNYLIKNGYTRYKIYIRFKLFVLRILKR